MSLRNPLAKMSARGPILETAEGFVRLLYPPHCSYTGESIAQGCLSDATRNRLLLDADEPTCWRCALPVGPYVTTEPNGCDQCRTDRFAFARVIRLGHYRGELAMACQKLKRRSGHHLAVALADLLFDLRGDDIRKWNPTHVVPVPLHWFALWRRGYNQAESIASRLASHLGIPCRPRWLVRRKPTRRQHFLSTTERHSNVREAFGPRRARSIRGGRVLLVDDVLTTGATCHQAARALLSGGTASVSVAVIARAGRRN